MRFLEQLKKQAFNLKLEKSDYVKGTVILQYLILRLPYHKKNNYD